MPAGNMLGYLMGAGVTGAGYAAKGIGTVAGLAVGLPLAGGAMAAKAGGRAVNSAMRTRSGAIGGAIGSFGGYIGGGGAGFAAGGIPGMMAGGIAGAAAGGAVGAVGGNLLTRAVVAGGKGIASGYRGAAGMLNRGGERLNTMSKSFLTSSKNFISDVKAGYNQGRNLDTSFIDNMDPVGIGKMDFNFNFAAPKVSSNNAVTPPAGGGAATPGASLASNADVGGAGSSGFLAGMSPLGTAVAMGAVGGGVSYMTGGNFMQGAALGAAGGYGMMKAGMAGSALTGKQLKGSFLGKEMGGNLAKMSKDARRAGRDFFADTGSRRAAMLAGSGLTGMVFGGNRRSHKRGFNSRRGNGF